jgi:radical SAM protein with 4Fe4S-binding SPASM domain
MKHGERYFKSVVHTNILSSPNTVYLDVTYACSLKCIHCHADAGTPSSNELTASEIKRLIDEMAHMKVFRIVFGGGEPLLRGDALELIEYAARKRIAPILITNGTLIDKQIAHRLFKAGLMTAQITINSAKTELHDEIAGCPGAFDRAVEAAKLLIKNRIYVLIATTVMSCNFREIPGILKLISKIHAPAYRLLRFAPLGRGRKHPELSLQPEEYKELVEIFLRERAKYMSSLSMEFDETFTFLMPIVPAEEDWQSKPLGCPAAKTLCAISPTGKVVPCSLFSERSLIENLECDDIRKKSIKNIWLGSKLLNKLRRIKSFKGKCMECRYLYLCGGGCRAITFSLTKDLLQADPLCPWSVSKI